MGNAFIGKISALVTASTADLERKLRGSKAEIDRFGNSLSSTIGRASKSAEASLAGIFTPLQRLERAIAVSLGAGKRLRIIDEDQAKTLRAAVQVAEQINKPLAGAQRTFTQLSAAVAGEFAPALERAQGKVVFLNNRLANTGNVSQQAFDLVQKSIQKTIVSINQLADAQQRLRGLATGNELEFSDPRLAANLAAARRAGQQALTLPAQAIAADPQIEGLVRQINAVSEKSVAAAAKVKAALGTPGEAGAKREAERLNAALGGLISLLNKKYQVIVDTAAAQKSVKELRAELDRSLTGRPQNFDQVAAEYQRLRGEVEKLDVAQRQAFGADLGRLITLISQNDVKNLEEARNLLRQIGEQLEGLEPAAPDRLSAAADRIRQRAEAERRAADEREAELETRRGQSTNLRASLLEQGRRRVQGRTGDVNIDSTPVLGSDGFAQFNSQAQRDIDALGARVGAVRQQLETLPNSVRTRFIPELQRAQAQLVKLQNAPLATSEAIEAAARRVQRLEAAAERARQALSISTAKDFIGSISTSRAQGELLALQQVLARVGAEAGGPAAKAYDALANATRRAVASGTAGLPSVRKELERLQVEAARAAAATGKISFGGALNQIRRGGDVATKSFQNVGLAFNQLAFAVDDFFSVTGGIEQRIRAVGNNITQLGVIIGQTKGLVVALAAVLVAQGLAAYIRWANGSTEAQDRTKALNEALARQKSLVEDLARAFESLGDRQLRGTFSPAAEEAREVASQLDEIRRKQRELRDASVVDLDPDVQRQRAIQGARQRQLEGEENVGRRIALQEQIAAARRAEQAAAAAAVDRAAPTPREVQEGLLRTIFRDSRGAVTPAGRQQAEQIRQGVTGAAGDPRQLIQLLQQARAEQNELALQNAANQVRAPRARENVEVLTQLINGLERQLGTGIDAAANRLLQSIDGPGRRLREVQDRLSEAGVGESAITNSVNEIAAQLDAAQQVLVDRLKKGLPIDQDSLDAATRARDAALKNAEATLSAASAAASFARALERAGIQLADTVAGESQSRADQARREANRQAGLAEAGLGLPGDVEPAQRQRARAEASAREAEEARDRLRDRAIVLRQRFASIARNAENAEALQDFGGEEALEAIRIRDDLVRQAAEFRQQFRDRGGEANLDAAQQLDEAARAAERRLEEILLRSRRGQEIGEQSDAIDRREAAARELEQSINRGRELGRSLGERAGRELAQGVLDLKAALDDAIQGLLNQAGGRPQDVPQAELDAARADFEADRRRLIDDSLRQNAPAIFGLADQVANAVAQGPSRAALQATDVSTVEGARELNRLLRGDDSARDQQSLVELQRQSKLLEELVQAANNPQVAN